MRVSRPVDTKRQPVRVVLSRQARRTASASLPLWPFAVMFLGYPVWWVLGIGDLGFPLLAIVMVGYLARARFMEVPTGFGIWLLFVIWMACSVIEIDSAGRLLGFLYRFSLYASVTVLFVYLFNARKTITRTQIGGVLTGFWLIVVAGGYLAVFFPLFSFATPLAYVLPDNLLSNELVREMAFRRVTQFDPTSVVALDPRPSAPFLYTNGWGNAYSLLLPIVAAYAVAVRGSRRFWWILLAIPVSFVPAFLTLNRGMFLGIAVAVAYVVLRLMLRGSFAALLSVLALTVIVGLSFSVLPVQDRLFSRLETSSTTEDRASLYQETFERTLESPVFGYGAPRPSESGGPSVGTQGQIWTLMFSHGFLGAALFVLWFALAFFRSLRERDPLGLASNALLLVFLVEIVYYGVMTSGLAVGMIAAAVTTRQRDGESAESN